MTTKQDTFVYVTYIATTPEKLWHALTDAKTTAAYWGHANVSEYRAGSSWEHQRTDGSKIADVVGEVVEATPPTKLVLLWREPGADKAKSSRVTFSIEPKDGFVRLTVRHEDLPGDQWEDAAHGWSAVLSNLKTLLETGNPLPSEPWK
jgi:uncharacterized protein YndB with AHSA1/START domain